MRTHLTWEEIEKYIDDSDVSEEYLLWFQQVSEHIEACELCQNRIQKAVIMEEMLEEANINHMLKLANQEEEIRRNIVICKMYQMAQDNNTKEDLKQGLQQMIQKMQQDVVKTYFLQAMSMQKRAGVARGEKVSLGNGKDDLRTEYEDGILRVYRNNEPKKEFSAVLNRKEKNPQIAKALWVEETECFVAEFKMNDIKTDFEIYIIP